MNENQHGFRPGRSCLILQIEHYDLILDQHGNVVYLDFAKNFDKVDHGILCHKLKSIGVGGKVVIWLYNFLRSRLQTVVENGITSSPWPVVRGAPKWTVLWPILFLIHIADINNNTTSHVASFADVLNNCKTIENMVPTMGVAQFHSRRHGRLARIPNIMRRCPQSTQTLKEGSLAVLGLMLFNCIPNNIRDLTGYCIDSFKATLDGFITSVPDPPHLPGYGQNCTEPNNSVITMVGAQPWPHHL